MHRIGVASRLLVLSLLVAGCGDDITPPTIATPGVLTFAGWEFFEEGDYSSALSRFYGALAENALYVDAYDGLGWTWLRLGSFTSSAASFDQAIACGLRAADPFAGKVLALGQGAPFEYHPDSTVCFAAASAESALMFDPKYVFAHDASIDWRDLRVVIADCWLRRAQYWDAYRQVVALGGVTLDPSLPSAARILEAEVRRLSDEASTDSSRLFLARNWRAWLSLGPQDYDYTLRLEYYPSVVALIHVRDGIIEDLRDSLSGASLDDTLALYYRWTIDDLLMYAHMELLSIDCFHGTNRRRAWLDYDDRFGYPTRFRTYHEWAGSETYRAKLLL